MWSILPRVETYEPLMSYGSNTSRKRGCTSLAKHQAQAILSEPGGFEKVMRTPERLQSLGSAAIRQHVCPSQETMTVFESECIVMELVLWSHELGCQSPTSVSLTWFVIGPVKYFFETGRAILYATKLLKPEFSVEV